MSDFATKAITDVLIKSVDRGEVTAVISTMDVVDRDHDVVLSGAIKAGTVVKVSAYAHDTITEGKAPVGQGVVTIDGNRAILAAKYFLSTERGRDAFHTVRELGTSSEWSIGFAKNVRTSPLTPEWKAKGAQRLIAGLDLFEASPVFMAANQYTRTLEAKATAAAVEAVDAAEAAFFRDLYNRYALPAMIREHDQERKEFRAESDLNDIMLRTLEREATRPDSYDAPEAFNRVVEFARDSLGLDWRALPAPRIVRAGSLKNAHGDRLRGVFLIAPDGRPRIFLEDGRDDEAMLKTYFHESAHARQCYFGDEMTERGACEQADRLFGAWQRHEADER